MWPANFYMHTRDVAAFCEYRRDDPRRGCSTVWFPENRAKCDQNETELGQALGVSAARAQLEARGMTL